MRAVTIGTFGDPKITKPVGFSVHRFQVCLGQLAMTGPAGSGDLGQELILADVLDRVRGVAPGTGGKILAVVRPRRIMNALRVLTVDPAVTGAAGGWNVLLVNARPLVQVIQDFVRPMAIDANRAGEESLLGESPAVHAVGIIGKRGGLAELGDLAGFAAGLVALPAEGRHLGPVGARGLIFMRADVMTSVASGAARGFGDTSRRRLAMAASRVLFGNFGVAIRTVHLVRGRAGTREARIDVVVALDAGNIAMNGSRQHLRIHDDRRRVRFRGVTKAGRFMAFETAAVGNRDAYVFFPNLVGEVAIGAGRNGSGRLFPYLPLDDLNVNVLDPGVALHAGCGNVPWRDGRSRIGVGQDQVTAMAVIAGRGNDEALLEQPLSMNALTIVFEDIVFGDLVHASHRRSLAMASPTKKRNLHFVGLGFRVLRGKNLMRAVAVRAVWRVGRLAIQGLPMYGGREIGLGLVVAGSALHPLQARRVRQVFRIYIRMALNAFQMFMNRALEGILVHEQGVAPGFSLGTNARVVVTVEAGAIIPRPGSPSSEEDK